MTPFAYIPGRSVLHRLDPRVKLVGLALLTITGLRLPGGALTAGICLLLLVMAAVPLSLPRLFRSMGFLLCLLAMVILTRSVCTPGDVLVSGGGFTVTRQGAIDGLTMSGRILFLSLSGLLLTAVSSAAAIRSALIWLLRPIPGIPEQRAAMMICLLLRFIPLILEQIRATVDAQKARGAGRIRNPVRRLLLLAIPILRRVFLDADHLVLAMTARCHTEFLPPPRFSPGPMDMAALLAIQTACGFLVFPVRLPF